MSKESRWNGEHHSPQPVEKIEISEKKQKLRLWSALALAAFGIVMLVISLAARLRAAEGWQEITPNTSTETHCGGDFVLLYNIDGKKEATPQKKQLISLYTDALIDAYRIFNADSEFDGVGNLAYLNNHPNETVTVEPALYEALEKLVQADCRSLYMRPAYIQYDNLFRCKDEYEAEAFDPFVNEEMRAYYLEIANFASNPEDISVELCGDNRVVLHLSDRMVNYTEQNEIDGWLDLYWLENAFKIDYLAERLRAEGFLHGCLSSYDGYAVSLGDMEEELSLSVYNREDNRVSLATTLMYSEKTSFVSLRDFPLSAMDGYLYYEVGNGIFRTRYIDPKDGICKTAEDSLLAYSGTKSCADIAIAAAPFYIAETFDEEGISKLSKLDIFTIYSDGNTVYSSNTNAKLSDASKDEK